jgi:hypothetical protein
MVQKSVLLLVLLLVLSLALMIKREQAALVVLVEAEEVVEVV